MHTFLLRKLVRDKLLDEYIAKNQQPDYRVLGADEFRTSLIDKLHEETDELRTSTPESIENELADVVQVIYDLARLHDISLYDLEEARAAKQDKKGGFQKGVYVESLTLADDDEWVDYYRRDSARYPEV